MKNYILNVELISKKKFDKDEFQKLKNIMELDEDYIEIYEILINHMEINFNKFIEINIEDLEIEYDISDYVEKMLEELDDIIPGGLANDSKLEYSDNEVMTEIWYKYKGEWVEKISDNERIIFDERNWNDDDYINTMGGYNDYTSGIEKD